MRAQVKKWGNSAAVRIPASVMAAAALSIDPVSTIATKLRSRVVGRFIGIFVFTRSRGIPPAGVAAFPNERASDTRGLKAGT